MKSTCEFFRENGFYHARGVFSAREISELDAEFDSIVEDLNHSSEEVDATWGGAETKRLKTTNSQITHTHNVQLFSACWLRALQHPKLLEPVRSILGNDIVLHHTKLFCKPPELGSPFPIHQDWSYFPTLNDTMMAGIIHVSEATDRMGCLRIFPGSHKLGRLENSSGQADQIPESLRDYPIENAQIIEAQAGDVVFFHYFTLHGSMPNRSDKARKTVLAQFYAGDDDVEPGVEHVNERLVLSGRNARMTRSLAERSS